MRAIAYHLQALPPPLSSPQHLNLPLTLHPLNQKALGLVSTASLLLPQALSFPHQQPSLQFPYVHLDSDYNFNLNEELQLTQSMVLLFARIPCPFSYFKAVENLLLPKDPQAQISFPLFREVKLLFWSCCQFS